MEFEYQKSLFIYLFNMSSFRFRMNSANNISEFSIEICISNTIRAFKFIFRYQAHGVLDSPRLWHYEFIHTSFLTEFHKSDAGALKDRNGVVSENTFWWALKVLARKWSLWTSPERAVWMPNQRRASKTRNRPGIRDKHLQACGHRQHQLSHEDNGPLIRTMIAPARFSLSTGSWSFPLLSF